MTTKDAEISKARSHALRHEPWLYELELDDEGWATLDAVLVALREQQEEWRGLSRTDGRRRRGHRRAPSKGTLFVFFVIRTARAIRRTYPVRIGDEEEA